MEQKNNKIILDQKQTDLSKFVKVYDNVIPIQKDGNFNFKLCKKCVGIKVFSYKGIQSLYDKKSCLDKVESLEELKYVELGFKVKLHKIKHIGFGIDIPSQVKLLENRYYENK